MRRRDRAYALLAVLMILLMVWNEVREDNAHHAFFDDVRGFINQGGRNTAEDGRVLCQRINEIAAAAGPYPLRPLDCDSRYAAGDDH